MAERLDVRGPRYNVLSDGSRVEEDFPVKPFVEALKRVAVEGNPIATYIHLPFCKSRLLYCGVTRAFQAMNPHSPLM